MGQGELIPHVVFRPGFIDAAYFKPGLDLNSYKFAITGVHLEQNNGTDIF